MFNLSVPLIKTFVCIQGRYSALYRLNKEGLSLRGPSLEDDQSGRRALFEKVYNESPQAICQNFSIFEKMKLPRCLCGITRGFHHEFSCWSCACLPWQHSSDEDHNAGLDSEAEEARRKYEEFQERIRQINEEEDRKIEEEKKKKYHLILSIIEDGEIKSTLKETREERQAAFQEEKRKLKKKKLKTKTKLDSSRRHRRLPFNEASYALNAYDYYRAKAEYEFDQVSFHMRAVFENGDWNTHRFLNAGISLSELNIQSYGAYMKITEEL